MNKAFIFDMDGVIVDDEQNWTNFEKTFYPELFGEEIAKKVGNTTGLGLDGIYEKAKGFGFEMDRKEYLAFWNKDAKKIYDLSPITKDIEKLADYLVSHGFKMGVVSASPLLWVNWVLERLGFKDKLEVVISIHERKDLHHKPAPDGYLEAMKVLHVEPENTIILEDSNAGIASGKAAGAFVIGFQENLIPDYQQTGADVYAKNIDEVIKIVEQRN